MRLFHTADWHLGRTLGGHSLQRDHEHLFSEQFVSLIDEHRPEAVLIAGDVFDRAVPPAEAVELLDEILRQVVLQRQVPVVLIPGNHDEARRLGFGARLLEAAGLHIGDSPLGRRWGFHDTHGPISIVAASYFTPLLLAQQLADGRTVTDHDAGMAMLAPMLHNLCPEGERRVLVAHAFVAGGAESESERGLAVGGSGQIGARHFEGFHYVALGHLHRPQSLAGGRLRYAGSPLAYSTSEAGQDKSVTLVEIDAAGVATTAALPLTPLHALRILHGTFAELADGASSDFVQLELTDREPVYEAQRKLAQRYPRIIGLRWMAEAPPPNGIAAPDAATRAADPLTLFERFHAAMSDNAPVSDAARPVLVRAVEAAQEADA